MKRLLVVLFISFSIFAIGQNDTINQIDSIGNKIGYWRYLNKNGQIKSQGKYCVFSKSELFYRGINYSDTIVDKSLKYGIWQDYNINGDILKKSFWDVSGENI